jgi:DNA-binding SARP family transcriptional activator
VQVTLLGPVAAESDGRLLPLGGRKQRCVFALLALNVNRTVALDRLVYEIWRDEPPARATVTLQAYISRLRRALAEVPDGQPGRIVTRRPGWVLELPAQQIDAVRFATMVADGQKQVDAGRPAAGAELLRSALDLWSGEPLADLDDVAFAVEDAARLHERRLDATEALLEAELAAGAGSAVVARAEAFVSANPFRERAWCALILALYGLGRQAEALAATRRLRETLADGLGLDPSPTARQLETMILNHDPALRATVVTTTLRPDMAAAPETTDRALPDTAVGAVVGRDAELARVISAADAANHGRGSLLIIEGPAGMGKSTILHALEGGMRAINGLVLRGAGGGSGATPALWPWITIVRRLRETMPELADADALALLDPSMGQRERSKPSDPLLARTRLYRAVIDLLAAARARGPLAVIIDDAHWVDRETLDLLALAADELVPAGVLIAVALRPDESPETRDIVAALGARIPGGVERIALRGLVGDDVARIVNRVAGPHDADVVSAVAARTGGNPFFVLELVQLLMSERRLDPDGVYAALPTGVRDVLRRRLDRLPEQTNALLSALALLGRPAPVGLLSAVTDLDEDSTLDGCEAAVLAGLLIDDAGSGGFGLTHDLVRQTLVEALSPARAVRLHARIGNSLRAPGAPFSPERVVEIAHHLTIATPIVGDAAVPYLLAAADDAFIRVASRSAEQYLITALELTSALPQSADRVLRAADIRSRLMAGRLIASSGDEPVASTALVEPNAVAPIDRDAPATWWSAVLLLVAAGDNLGAADAAAAAWSEDLPPGTAATVLFVLGLACFELGRLDESDEALSQSESLIAAEPGLSARGVFSFGGTVTALRACVAALRGDHVGAREFVRLARTVPDQGIVQSVAVDFWATWCAVQEGNLTTVNELAGVCIANTAQLGDSFYATSCRLFKGWAAAMAGDADGLAIADAAYAEYLTRFNGLRHQNTVQLTLRAEAYAHHGNLDRARELVHEARQIGALTGERTLGVRLSAFAGQVSAPRGGP